LDTQEECEEQKNSDSDTTAASSSSTSNAAETIKNRFGRSQDSLRPKSSNQQMLHLLKTQFEEDRKKQFSSMQNILQQQVGQRSRMLDIFQTMAQRRKRRRSSDSE
jgi:hypothetical protein